MTCAAQQCWSLGQDEAVGVVGLPRSALLSGQHRREAPWASPGSFLRGFPGPRAFQLCLRWCTSCVSLLGTCDNDTVIFMVFWGCEGEPGQSVMERHRSCRFGPWVSWRRG